MNDSGPSASRAAPTAHVSDSLAALQDRSFAQATAATVTNYPPPGRSHKELHLAAGRPWTRSAAREVACDSARGAAPILPSAPPPLEVRAGSR
jgi:hypothetical protein